MFLIRRPDRDAIDLFVRNSQDLPLSYNPPGIVRTASARRGIVEARVAVGRGPRDFERARAALLAWRQFDIDWIETFPKRAPDVMYRIRATSWPRTTLTLVGHPIVRALQARFRRDSAPAMTLAIGRPLPVS
jgi:Domain of unknown function (DUF1990)